MFLQASPRERKPGSTTAHHLSLPVTDSSYMNHRSRLNEIKQKEYKDYLEKVAYSGNYVGISVCSTCTKDQNYEILMS